MLSREFCYGNEVTILLSLSPVILSILSRTIRHRACETQYQLVAGRGRVQVHYVVCAVDFPRVA